MARILGVLYGWAIIAAAGWWMADNGWRSGKDPTLRALRAIAVISLIGLLIWWAVFDATENPLVGALLLGGLLASLFGDIGIALPFLRAEHREDDDDD